jgi:hypothetical protein
MNVDYTYDALGAGLILTFKADIKRASDFAHPTKTSIFDRTQLWRPLNCLSPQQRNQGIIICALVPRVLIQGQFRDRYNNRSK